MAKTPTRKKSASKKVTTKVVENASKTKLEATIALMSLAGHPPPPGSVEEVNGEYVYVTKRDDNEVVTWSPPDINNSIIDAYWLIHSRSTADVRWIGAIGDKDVAVSRLSPTRATVSKMDIKEGDTEADKIAKLLNCFKGLLETYPNG